MGHASSITDGFTHARATSPVRRQRRRPAPWAAALVRIGYAAKGFVYVLVGVLAVRAAVGPPGGAGPAGTRGAMYAVVGPPLGRMLLGGVAAGLAFYVLWQLFRTLKDPEHFGETGAGAAFRRLQYLVSALIHLGLVAAALRMVTGRTWRDDEENARGWTAALMNYPLGRWMVAVAGGVIAGVALVQIYKAWRSDLDRQLRLDRLGPRMHDVVVYASRFGMAARGLVFAMVGTFLILAAWHDDAARAHGLGGTLNALQRQPQGPWLLAAVALGLVAYGGYLFLRAKYRRIEIELEVES